MHKEARNAARLAIYAQKKGKFWEVHDAIFANSRGLGEARYLEIAREVGLDEGEVEKIMAEKRYEDRIDADVEEGRKYQVNSTPTSFVNGKRVKGAKPYAELKKIVEAELE